MSSSSRKWSCVVRCFSTCVLLAPWAGYTEAEPLLTLNSTSPGRAAAGNIDSRTLRFPGPSTLESRYPTGPLSLGSRYPPNPYTVGSRSPSSSNDAEGLYGTLQAFPLRGSIRDANYILNQGDRPNTNPAVPLVVQQALTLMADTLDELHIRVSRLENIILQNQDLQGSGSVDRVGTASPPSEESCPASNFTRVGDACYHFSVWRDQRSHWKDASDACEGMGAKLAEPLTRTAFISLTQHLSLAPATTGFNYWIGGLYPGVSWRWSYVGKEVTLDPSYWMREDSMGRKVVPGGTATGRCLTLTYVVKASDYFYSADECGFEKYYICELLEKNHRRL
ncbi:uncharacterized protein [Procambarus clarkii]|uniref:uncharacterized protein isoform X2 n=1 Tax=Procambarus clarkii TaxID=6728 RepID=UPI00374230E5